MFSLYDINKDGVLSPTEIRFVEFSFYPGTIYTWPCPSYPKVDLLDSTLVRDDSDIPSDPKWPQVIQSDPKWPQVIRSDPKWPQVIPSDDLTFFLRLIPAFLSFFQFNYLICSLFFSSDDVYICIYGSLTRTGFFCQRKYCLNHSYVSSDIILMYVVQCVFQILFDIWRLRRRF